MAARPSDGSRSGGTPSFRTYISYGCHVHAPVIIRVIREEHLGEGAGVEGAGCRVPGEV